MLYLNFLLNSVNNLVVSCLDVNSNFGEKQNLLLMVDCCRNDCLSQDIECKSLDDDEDDELSEGKQVVVGICAMAKKSQSRPMKEILKRLNEFEYIKTEIFSEEVILNVINFSPRIKPVQMVPLM